MFILFGVPAISVETPSILSVANVSWFITCRLLLTSMATPLPHVFVLSFLITVYSGILYFFLSCSSVSCRRKMLFSHPNCCIILGRLRSMPLQFHWIILMLMFIFFSCLIVFILGCSSVSTFATLPVPLLLNHLKFRYLCHLQILY